MVTSSRKSLVSSGCLRSKAECTPDTVFSNCFLSASASSLAFRSFSVSPLAFSISLSLPDTSSLSPAFSFASLSTSFLARILIEALLMRSRASISIFRTSFSLLSYDASSLSAESSTPSRYSLAVNKVSNLLRSSSTFGLSSSSSLC